MSELDPDGSGDLLWIYKTPDILDIAKWQKRLLLVVLASLFIGLLAVLIVIISPRAAESQPQSAGNFWKSEKNDLLPHFLLAYVIDM